MDKLQVFISQLRLHTLLPQKMKSMVVPNDVAKLQTYVSFICNCASVQRLCALLTEEDRLALLLQNMFSEPQIHIQSTGTDYSNIFQLKAYKGAIMRFAQMFEKKNTPSLSFEFFRPKTEKAEINLDRTIDILSEHNPDYMTVTFGAGGSSREGSFELIDKLRNKRGFDVVAYIAGVGLGPEDIESVLARFSDLGVENVFAIRGDEPKGDAAFQPHPEALPHASDLIQFIKNRYDFCVGAAGYPEGHIEAESKDQDIDYLKLKQDCGAEYIIAQFCYDNNDFYDFIDRCKSKGITVPILPGIMPIYSHTMLEKVAEVCGARIPEEVKRELDKISTEDKEAVQQFGIDYATKQCADLLNNGVQGLHFYTMNRAASVDAVLRNLREQGHFQ